MAKKKRERKEYETDEFVRLHSELQPKQQAFVDAYLSDPTRNSQAAARKAGYKGRVDVQASRMLAHAKIKACINAALKSAAKKLVHTQSMYLGYLYEVASMSIEECIGIPGGLTAKVAACKAALPYVVNDATDADKAAGYRFELRMVGAEDNDGDDD